MRIIAILVLLAASIVPAAAGMLSPGPVPQWIWLDRLPRNSQTVYLRRDVVVRSPLKQAGMRVLADDRAVVFVNGRKVSVVTSSREPAAIDVTADLKVGENVVAIEAWNNRGPAGVLVQLDLIPADGLRTTIVTDPLWRVSTKADDGWNTGREEAAWPRAHSCGLIGCPPWGESIVDTADYHQWKHALTASGTATAAGDVAALPGFQVELLRSAQPGEGSWVSLEFDGRGRVTIGREGPGLVRYTLPAAAGDAGKMEVINDTLLECRGLLYAHDSLYAHANNSKGLYRLRDTDGDDRFDDVRLLKATPGNVGHGRNDLALGPEGKIYVICGNDARLPEDYTVGQSPYRDYADDRLLKCSWDRYLFDRQAVPPGGYVARTDPEGKSWELVAGGFRNPYGLDFSSEGELFTFDADNEGDTGLPWYRPNRVLHVVSGGEFGWRQGSGIRPGWYPDSVPATLDIGKASPTSVKFGTRSNFPEKYKRALFILDWSYGRIYAIHLIPRGSSYTAAAEVFIAGRPLNVTDLGFGPDGAMYFVTGGRGTQSGLYRVKFIGPEMPDDQPGLSREELAVTETLRKLRRSIEERHGGRAGADNISPALGSDDPWLRHAARIALESAPASDWREQALTEQHFMGAITSLMALARVGQKDDQAALLSRLIDVPLITPEPRLAAMRTCAISLARHGVPGDAPIVELKAKLELLYPVGCHPLNQLTGELLAALESPQLVAKTIPLLETAATQEEALNWLFLLRNVRQGWTLESRRAYFRALKKANVYEGGRDMVTALTSIRFEALATLTPDERRELAAELSPPVPNVAEVLTPNRPLVREWKLDELSEIEAVDRRGDAQRGRKLFTELRCDRCHRMHGEGLPVGPDLTGVALRMGRRDLLVTVLEPSKVIDEKFRNITFELKSGRVVTGRVITGDDQKLLVSPNPLEPDTIEIVPHSEIASQTPSAVSPMPAGLFNTLTPEEIVDVLTYLETAPGGR